VLVRCGIRDVRRGGVFGKRLNIQGILEGTPALIAFDSLFYQCGTPNNNSLE